MDLYDFRGLLTDESQPVRIYNVNNDCELMYEGDFDRMPNVLEDYEITSVDSLYTYSFDGFMGFCVAFDEDDREQFDKELAELSEEDF